MNLRGMLFGLFALSGFSGLIYESIWSHYLKLFLGHAAYAQTLVLAIFMGGMAIGSWVAARGSMRWRNLLLGYAVVEGVIGIAGMTFHPLFESGMRFTFDAALPALGSPWSVQMFKWGSASLLILPQSILLGMTFPLMSGALVRAYPERSGSTIATLYFTNSLGGAIGVLTGGFVLLPMVGLPGTILAAGLLNIVLALVVWLLSKADIWDRAPAVGAGKSVESLSIPLFLLLVAALTGTASFIYEIAWLRMLSLVLGATTHAFELMLSAFIGGLAFGSLWIRGRLDGLRNPMRFLGGVQVLMGVFALATLVFYGGMFDLMAGLVSKLPKTSAGYTWFNIGSHAIALSVMLPTTFCAGMTLPLITHRLLKLGYGERSIGHVYAFNTIGAILGVFLAVHIGLPHLGLKGLLVAGAGIDIALGIVILHRYAERERLKVLRVGAAVGVLALVTVLLVVQLDVHRMASGVYRSGKSQVQFDGEVTFHRDGKTATVNIIQFPGGVVALSTNGKPDASMQLNLEKSSPSLDEYTMVLLGALPLAAVPDAKTAAVIGFGSGLSTHVLLGSEVIQRVDTVEIEPAIVEASKVYRPRVERAYSDPRSRVYIEDAKTFFSLRQSRYDIIVSEPSTTWVSGIAGLYTEEFYRFVSQYLKPDGVFTQWIHLAELSPQLVASVFHAMGRVFPDYAVYDLNSGDIAILAGSSEAIRTRVASVFAKPRVAQELTQIGIRSPQDIAANRLGSRRLLEPIMQAFPVAANSDYFPILDLYAVRSRFLGESATALANIGLAPVPLAEMLDGTAPQGQHTRLSADYPMTRIVAGRTALAIRKHILRNALEENERELLQNPTLSIAIESVSSPDCSAPDGEDAWLDALLGIAKISVPYLRPGELESMWQRVASLRCAKWSSKSSNWLQLVDAASRRAPVPMANVAESLLGAGGLSIVQTEYLVANAMLGHLSTAQAEQARNVWNRYGAALTAGIGQPLYLRIMVLLAQ